MNIWILNHYARMRSTSGITTHGVIAHYLRQCGHSITLFPAAFSQPHFGNIDVPKGRPFIDQWQEEKVRYRFVRTRAFRNTLGRLANCRSYRANVPYCTDDLEKPDVVIGSCPHPYAVDAAGKLARRFDVPFLYEIRDIWPQSLVDLKNLSKINPLYWHFRQLELRAFRHADGVLAVHPGMPYYAEQYGIPLERCCYVPNGIDPELYTTVAPAPETEPFVISYFGVFGSLNDLSTIVEAAAKLQADPRGQGILLRLIGDGRKKKALMQRAANLGLRNIDFRDPVPKTDLAELAHQSHAFIFSNYYMSVLDKYGMSGVKVFDYLMAARPIVFACKAFYDPVRESDAGITVEPENPDAMAEAMIRLRDTPAAERWQMGQRGRAFVQEHHDLSMVARRLDGFLKKLLAQPEAPQHVRKAA